MHFSDFRIPFRKFIPKTGFYTKAYYPKHEKDPG